MSLNIKNPETVRLIRELADLTGQSMTAAVTDAVRNRIEDVRRGTEGEGMSDRIMAIAADMRARLPLDFFDVDHGELLYDDDGLPR